MRHIVFDFNKIETKSDFYRIAVSELALPQHFGENLDALWDVLTGEIELPVNVKFENLTLEKLDKFEQIISLFEEASDELEDEFEFEYFLKNEELNLGNE